MEKTILFILLIASCVSCATSTEQKPNILFCIADDWGWPHAGAYGDSVVRTPMFDKLAREGILFENAFVSSPSCTPSRSAILTGQHFWRLGESANLWSTLDTSIPVYPLMLQRAGYYVGSWRKSWGPGDLTVGGYIDEIPAGKKYELGLAAFLDARPKDTPFCFWLGASDPHRKYEQGSGAASGIALDQIDIPKFYPDIQEIRADIADYYFEVQRFDADVAAAIALLDSLGELDNTIVVVTGDHGMPFPRCKGNLYDMGVRVPLVIKPSNQLSWEPKRVADFVSLTDLAPTFLNLAGVDIPVGMTGLSLMPLFGAENKEVEPDRSFVVFGRERHTPAQMAPSIAGYPSRGIRTHEFLYIHNFEPTRWPAGVADGASHPMNAFADCDNGPTKTILLTYENKEGFEQYFNWSFGRRPQEELYAVAEDPGQLTNLAANLKYQSIKNELKAKLINELKDLKDPRALNQKIEFDTYPYRAPYELNAGDK